jgi:hypothetical protein
MVKSGHEINCGDEQEPRRECVPVRNAKSSRVKVETINAGAVLVCETGASKINLTESNAGSKEKIVTFSHTYPPHSDWKG